MAALATKTTVPVPEMLWQERDTSVLGAEFFVMGHVPGRVPTDNPPYSMEGWILEETEERQHTLATSALDVMCAIHQLDPHDTFGHLTDRMRRGLDEEL